MSLHDLNLFTSVGMSVTPQGIFDGPIRVKQGVKGQLIDVLDEREGVGFIFDSAHINWGEKGEQKIIISVRVGEKKIQIVGDFSIEFIKKERKKNRYIKFNNISYKSEFGGSELSQNFLPEIYTTIRTQLQIFVLNELFKKEELENLAEF